MKIAVFALSLALMVSAGCQRSATGYQPEPRRAVDPIKVDSADKTSLFPLREGSQWVYVLQLSRIANGKTTFSGTGEVIYRVAKSEERNGTIRATLELLQGGEVVDRQIWFANDKGIYQATVLSKGKDVPFAPSAQPVILNPPDEGKKFTWSGSGIVPTGTEGTVAVDSVIEANREVDTEIDRFNAVAVRSKARFTTGKQRGTAESTIWLTPGVGLVRYFQETNVAGQGNVVTLKLKSFSLK